jgi:hypothetical protein
MSNPPPADQLPGKIELRPPKGEEGDRPLERIRKGLPPQKKIEDESVAQR